MKRKTFRTAVVAFIICALALSGSGFGALAAEIDPSATVGEGEAGTETPVDDNALPESYSSRDLGYVTSVKDQTYSSCWAYGSLGTLESLLLRSGESIDSMSANHLNVWATTRSDGTGWIRTVQDDGFPVIALGYFTSWQGGVPESDLGDFPLTDNAKGEDAPVGMAKYGITSAKYLSKSRPEEIKQEIMEHGGVFTSYSHAASCMSKSNISYYMPPTFAGSYQGHSIEVVGWNDNYPRSSFTGDAGRPKNNGAWLIKNSWGDNNSLGGYFWMSYEDANIFANRYVPSYALTGYEKIDDSKKLIQNEIYGATYEFRYVHDTNLTYLNRLSFDDDYNTIDKIVFKTEALGADYTLYYVPDGNDGKPTADSAAWTKLYNGTVDYQGYICADIEDFVPSAKNGSIAVTIDTSNTDADNSFGVGEWLTSNGDYVFLNSSHRNESYIMQNGNMQDLLDWYKENENDDMGGTFVIKAITTAKFEPSLLGDADLDGIVNVRDVTVIQRHIAEYKKLKGVAAANADYNRDGEINIKDATAVQRLLAEYDNVIEE